MSQETRLNFRACEGPSLFAPFPAVIAEFSSPFTAPIAAAKLAGRLANALPAQLPLSIAWPQGDVSFEQTAALLTAALQDLAGPCELPADLQYSDTGTARIAIGFYDQLAAVNACQSALRIAYALFASEADGADRNRTVAASIQQTTNTMRARQPDSITRALMIAARARNIPFSAVSPGSRQWCYGQGSVGSVFFGTGNQRDSLTGNSLVRNKFLCNQFVVRLGLPGVEHGLANTPQEAAQIANRLGFPVVVKPIDQGKGRGVSANIANVDELRTAFAKAASVSKQAVLVERHIAGDDHRIAVFGGKFKWCVRRSPPRIVGNDRNTIAELIDLENRSRSDADVAAGFVKRLVIDADMRAVLAKQGLAPDDRPAAGRSIVLRSIANTSTGGDSYDCSASVHPDNREMAEAIARNFRMDALGIDFMTTDISKSWREQTCAIIEVNSTPGFSIQSRADLIIADKFPPGSDGRLPSVVLIGANPAIVERVSEAVQAFVKCVGQTDGNTTLIAGQPRCRDSDPLPARVLAMVLDASCEAFVIGAKPQEIERHGFPLDRCDLALIVEPTSISATMRKLIDACASEVVDDVTGQNFDDSALASIVTRMENNASPTDK